MDKMTEVAVLACSVETGTEDVVGVADRRGEVPFPRVETDALTKVAAEAGVCDWKGQWLTLGGHLEIVETSVTDTTASPDDVAVELRPAVINVAIFTEEVGVEPTTSVVAFELEAGVLKIDAGALELAPGVLELKALLLDADKLELREALETALLELKTALEEDDVVLDGATLELEGVLLELESLIEELGAPADDATEVDEVTAEELAIVTEDTAWVVDTAAVVVAT